MLMIYYTGASMLMIYCTGASMLMIHYTEQASGKALKPPLSSSLSLSPGVVKATSHKGPANGQQTSRPHVAVVKQYLFETNKPPSP